MSAVWKQRAAVLILAAAALLAAARLPRRDARASTEIFDEETPLAALPEEADPYEGLDETQIKYVEEVLALVNAEREKAGLAPLTLDPALREAAQTRAAECVRSFSHTRPDGRGYKTAISDAGVTASYTGENVATGHTTPRQVVKAWMASEGHRANILNERFTRIGVGLEKNTGGRYRGYAWTQLFADG